MMQLHKGHQTSSIYANYRHSAVLFELLIASYVRCLFEKLQPPKYFSLFAMCVGGYSADSTFQT